MHHTAPDVLSLNFFSRHTAFRHKIYKEFMKIVDDYLGTLCVCAYESLIVFVSQLVHIVQILTFFIDVY